MPRSLLVVDDAMIIREMIKDAALEQNWVIAGEAANGEEAIEQYKLLRPDAVTLDLVMPQYDGLHGLKGILECDPEARVLIVSALDQMDVLENALRIGAADFTIKPFQKDRLIGALQKICAPRQGNELSEPSLQGGTP